MKTVITNVCGKTRFYGFLPPHGRTLTANQSVTLPGDLRTVLASGRGRYKRERELLALDNAEKGVDIEYRNIQTAHESSSSSNTH
jgi:hypothetical protein